MAMIESIAILTYLVMELLAIRMVQMSILLLCRVFHMANQLGN